MAYALPESGLRRDGSQWRLPSPWRVREPALPNVQWPPASSLDGDEPEPGPGIEAIGLQVRRALEADSVKAAFCRVLAKWHNKARPIP